MMTDPTSKSKLFLDHYVSEKLPQLFPGGLEVAGDPPGFTVDQRYVPLKANV